MLRQRTGFESGHLSKLQNWRHKHRSGQHILARQKNIHKKVFHIFVDMTKFSGGTKAENSCPGLAILHGERGERKQVTRGAGCES